MIENFLIYSFGKLVKEKNSTVWNWICTASDEFNFLFVFFVFVFESCPGSNRSKLRAMRADFSYVTVCCVWYTVTRHAQTRTWGVQSQLQLRVLFSADL